MTTDPTPTAHNAQAEAILGALGGATNVKHHTHCMTRLRVTLVTSEGLVDTAALRQIPGVLGVIDGNPIQIVLGPAAVKHADSAFAAALAEAAQTAAPAPTASATEAVAAPPALPPKRGNPMLRQLLRRIAAICTPLIPALIGAGLVKALAGLLLLWAKQHGLEGGHPVALAAQVASLIGSGFFAFLVVQVGMNAAREFDGSPSLGGAVASVMILPALTSLPAFELPGLGPVTLQPGQGGLMGALMAGALVAAIEKRLRTRLPAAIETLLTPTLTLLVAGSTTLLVLMPVASVLTEAIGHGTQLLLSDGGMPAAFVLAASFIGLLMFGLHQALIPIHAQLITQYGYTALFPILAMSGCGQAGAAIALYFKYKHPALRRKILNTLPTCMLGISEPLLYSVTLPLGRPLITCSLGAGAGAMVLGYLASQGNYVGATTIGPANLMLLPLVTGPMGLAQSILAYACAALVAYSSAFALTWIFAPREQALNSLP